MKDPWLSVVPSNMCSLNSIFFLPSNNEWRAALSFLLLYVAHTGYRYGSNIGTIRGRFTARGPCCIPRVVPPIRGKSVLPVRGVDPDVGRGRKRSRSQGLPYATAPAPPIGIHVTLGARRIRRTSAAATHGIVPSPATHGTSGSVAPAPRRGKGSRHRCGRVARDPHPTGRPALVVYFPLISVCTLPPS